MAEKYVFENEDSDDQKAEEEEQIPVSDLTRSTWLQETHGLALSSILHFVTGLF